jgi:hypothetical protein
VSGHAYLSASGSHRWLHCTASAAVEAQLPNSTSSFAEEGTRAHTVAYECLSQEITARQWREQGTISLGTTAASEEAAMEQLEHFYADHPAEMMNYVQQFIDYVNERITHARSQDARAEVLLEQRLDFSRWVPEGFGTGDVVLVYAGTVEVIDLKYGKGVKVEVDGNPQLLLYGLGAYHELDHFYDIERVVSTIHQPRLDHVDTATISSADLLAWADAIVAPAAQVAFTGDGAVFAPSDDACRFCRAKATCRARAELHLETAKREFAEPELLSADEIAELLPKVDGLRKWIDAVQDYALKQAERGQKFPGFKLVSGRSNRRIADKEAAALVLLEAGYNASDVYEPQSLRTLGDLEKSIGKRPINELLGGLIDKPPGKPTLVPVSDKRPELEPRATAAEDFADEDDGADDGE